MGLKEVEKMTLPRKIWTRCSRCSNPNCDETAMTIQVSKNKADNPDKNLSSKTVFDGRAVKLRVDMIQMPDGRDHRGLWNMAPALRWSPLMPKMTSCWSVSTVMRSERSLEIPAGGVDPGEDPGDAVNGKMHKTGFFRRNWSNSAAIIWRTVIPPKISIFISPWT